MPLKGSIKKGSVTIGAKTALKLMTTVSEDRWMRIVHPITSRQEMPGAESIITTLAPAIDEYANGYGELADRVWEEEYEDSTYKPHLSLIGELMETRKDRRLKNRMKKNQAEPALSR